MATGGDDINDIDELSEITSNLSLDDKIPGEDIPAKEFAKDPNTTYIKKRFDNKDKEFHDVREMLANRTLDYINVSKFLHDTFAVPMKKFESDFIPSKPKKKKIEEDFIARKNDDSEEEISDKEISDEEISEGEISKEEKNYLKQLLKMKEDITKQANMLLKENRELEKKLIDKKLELRNSVKERNAACNEATKIYNKVSGNSLSVEDDPQTSAGNSEIELLKKRYERVQDMAFILYRLIAFSGVNWANKQSLLDLVLLTGRLINTPFDEHNIKDMEKVTVQCLKKIMDILDVMI